MQLLTGLLDKVWTSHAIPGASVVHMTDCPTVASFWGRNCGKGFPILVIVLHSLGAPGRATVILSAPIVKG